MSPPVIFWCEARRHHRFESAMVGWQGSEVLKVTSASIGALGSVSTTRGLVVNVSHWYTTPGVTVTNSKREVPWQGNVAAAAPGEFYFAVGVIRGDSMVSAQCFKSLLFGSFPSQ